MNWSVPWSVDWLTDRLIGLDWLIRKRTPSIFSFSTSTFMLFLRQESWFVRRWVHRHHNIQDFVVVGSDSLELSLARAATSLQTYFCRDKTRLLSRQKYASRDKRNVRLDKSFVAASILLSRQNTSFIATNTRLSRQNVCRDNNDTCGSSRQWYRTGFW